MKYVALLSGGKDSCFNLLHCQRNHHHLVAAATLSPSPGKDEIDSYMYQTVGQDAITLVAQALDVPLYRRVVQGMPVERAAEYGLRSAGGHGVDGDETEDLYALLCSVLEDHPDVQAVSVGAILSNYQRVRVEHVCRRLSLTPLAYLWQRNQTSLLSEIISSGLNAILIKIAGAGLTPSDLARSLSFMQPKLISLHQRFGTHPCGEGGEYETFTTDSPLFKSAIDITEKEVVVVDQNDVAPVAYLRIRQALLVNKVGPAASPDVTPPPLLEHPFEAVHTRMKKSLYDTRLASATDPVHSHVVPKLGPSVRCVGPWIAVGNVCLPTSRPRSLNVEEEVTHCFEMLQSLLANHSPPCSSRSELLSTSATIMLLLPDLDGPTFSSANTAYASFFGTSPPARACVGVGGEAGVGLDCLAWAGEPSAKVGSGMRSKKTKGEGGTRRALHVQSMSYWAPANIGPYSQAISIPPYTFISGQIGLIPSSLTLPSPPAAPSTASSLLSTVSSTLPLETALVLQHTARIIRAAPNSRLGDGSEGGFGGSDSSSELVECDAPRYTRGEGGWIQLAIYYLVRVGDVSHVRGYVESVDGLTPTLYVVLSSLPRGARVEKQVLVHSGRFITPDQESKEEDIEDEEQVVEKSPEFVQGDISIRDPEYSGDEIQVHYEVSGFPPSTEACAVIFVRGSSKHGLQDALVAQTAARMKAVQEFTSFWERTLTAKAFVSNQASGNRRHVVSFLEIMFGCEMPALTVVPSCHVGARVGSGWDWAVTLMAV